jgi:Diguanylate cyclase, GGDEF domain
MITRFGGDEFVVLQTGAAERSTPAAVARKLAGALDEAFEIDGYRLDIGASVGIAMASTDGTDVSELLKKADMALYAAKAEGGRAASFLRKRSGERRAGAPSLARDHAAIAYARRRDFPRRLRHRLFVDQLPAQIPVRQDQSRSILHARRRRRTRSIVKTIASLGAALNRKWSPRASTQRKKGTWSRSSAALRGRATTSLGQSTPTRSAPTCKPPKQRSAASPETAA